jgi:hypothetical protein
VRSRYTVLPWENADEYQAIVAALVAEHVPQGPTEEHLVDEIAGIVWRKRRLRLAEAAAHQRGLAANSLGARRFVALLLDGQPDESAKILRYRMPWPSVEPRLDWVRCLIARYSSTMFSM